LVPSKKSIAQQYCVEQFDKYCEVYDKSTQPEKINQLIDQDDKSVQTITVTISTKEQSTMMNSDDEKKTYSPLNELKQDTKDASILSRDKILKLLDQAQINTPLNTSRNSAGKEEYASILDAPQRHRQVVPLEKLLFGDC
jgi:hypothetical protein